MFSLDGWWQEVLTLAIAGFAALYVASKLFGWPQRKKSTGPNVQLGGRLARGLDRAQRTRSANDHDS